MTRKRFWHSRAKTPAAAPPELPLTIEHFVATAVIGRLQEVLGTHAALTAAMRDVQGLHSSPVWAHALRAQEALRDLRYLLEASFPQHEKSTPPTVTKTGETVH